MITKQQEADLKKYLKDTPAADRCMMYARGLKTTAMLWFLPVLGWIEPLAVPTLILSGALLKIGDQAHAGSASWHLPLTPHNGDQPLIVLTSLGWAGQIWPEDKGWPTGYPEEPGLRRLVFQVPNLNTFSFPPHPERGNVVLKILASKSQGVFPLPPRVNPDDQVTPTDEHRATFERLKADPSIFMPGSWEPGTQRKVTGIDFEG